MSLTPFVVLVLVVVVGLQHRLQTKPSTTMSSVDSIHARIVDSVGRKDLGSLRVLANELAAGARDGDADALQQMLFLARESAMNAGGDKGWYALSQASALRALGERPERLPIHFHLELVRLVRQKLDAGGDWLDEQRWRKVRANQARLWLGGLHRIEKTIDTSWRADNPPALHPVDAPPSIPSGASADSVQDPQIRAKYEEALARHREKLRAFSEQHQARQLLQTFGREACDYLVYLYATPPCDLDELDKLLRESGVDQALADSVRKAARERMDYFQQSKQAMSAHKRVTLAATMAYLERPPGFFSGSVHFFSSFSSDSVFASLPSSASSFLETSEPSSATLIS